jgi:hypothetical protein
VRTLALLLLPSLALADAAVPGDAPIARCPSYEDQVKLRRAPAPLLFTPHEGKHTLTVRERNGRVRLTATMPKEVWGLDAVGVDAGDLLLVVAVFDGIASGSSLFAVDARSGALRWSADVVQLNIQSFDLATGHRRFARTRHNWR